MALLNTAMNAVGTIAAIKSLTGGSSPQGSGKYNNFYSELRKNGVARTNLFEVTITPPRMLVGNETTRKLSLYAEGAQLPGLFLQTDDTIKRFGVGPQEHVPYSAQVNDTTITFIGDGRGEIYKFFYSWLQGIVRADRSPVIGSQPDRAGKIAYEVEFKEEYATTINIRTFDEAGQTILSYDLEAAFPKSIPDVSLSWSESSLMQFGIQFSYLQSRLTNVDEAYKEGKNGIGELSTLQKLMKVGTAVQLVSSLKRPRNIQEALSSASTVKHLF